MLSLVERTLAPLGEGEIRIRSLASAVNRSDLEIRAGNWTIRREPKFPYVPGLEVVGDVVECAAGLDIRVGDREWTMMQGLGGVRAERDGGRKIGMHRRHCRRASMVCSTWWQGLCFQHSSLSCAPAATTAWSVRWREAR